MAENRIQVRQLPVYLTLTHSVIDTESPAFRLIRQGEREGPANCRAERGTQSVHCEGGVSHEPNSAPQWCCSSVGRSSNGSVMHDLGSLLQTKRYTVELEAAVNAFRETLRESWTRRAIRMLTIPQPAPFLAPLSLSTVTSLRDREWEERERTYYDTAIAELNSLVRKYNAIAPYAVGPSTVLCTAYRARSGLSQILRDSSQAPETKWSARGGRVS